MTTSSLGIGSGLPLNTLLEQLTKSEKGALAPITRQQIAYTARLTAYGKLKSALTAFQTANTALNPAALYSATSATVSGKTFSATTSASAVAGQYQVTITQLAQAQSLISGERSSPDDKTGTAGATRTLTLTLGQGKKPVTLNLKDDQTSLTGLRDAINGAKAGVTASIIKIGDGRYCLSVTADATGASNTITLHVSGDEKLKQFIGYDATNKGMTQKTAAQDARLKINHTEITRASNTISDALEGITLNLTKADNTPQTLTVARDSSKLTTAINNWVNAFNALQDTCSSLTAYTAVAKGAKAQNARNGALLGDSTLRNIQSQLKNQLINNASTSHFRTLAQMGITQDTTSGKLKIDNDKLSRALSTHSGDIKTMMLGNGRTTGITTTMGTSLSRCMAGNGSLTTAINGVNESLKKLSSQYDATSERINDNIERYRKQFAQLDVLISSLNKTSDRLKQQFDALNGSSGKS